MDVNDDKNEIFVELSNKLNVKLNGPTSETQKFYNYISLINMALMDTKKDLREKEKIKKEVELLKNNISLYKSQIKDNQRKLQKMKDLVHDSNVIIKDQYVVKNGENLLPKKAIFRREEELDTLINYIDSFNELLETIEIKISGNKLLNNY